MFDNLATDFPILARLINGQRLVYLDSAATSQKPRAVIEAISAYYSEHNANVHRGVHQLGDESTQLFHDSRRTIAGFFGADPSELVITRGTTEGLNHLANRWVRGMLQPGDRILTTLMEHHSNLVPWQQVAQAQGAEVLYATVTADGQLDLADFERHLQHQSLKVVTLTHVSNALGTLNPLAELVRLVRKHQPEAFIVVDGAQAAPHLPITFSELDVDAYVCSAHKMLGPMGMGAILIKKKWLEQLAPFEFGGGMIDQVSVTGTTFTDNLEERFTAGTPDVAGLVGWAAACEYLMALGMSQVAAHDQQLVAYALERLAELPELQLIGPLQSTQRVGSVAFLYHGVHAHDVGQVLDSLGVAVRSGHHCTMPLHTKFGWAATTRISFHVYSTLADIDAAVTALAKVKRVFQV